jgi:hypothetical protein
MYRPSTSSAMNNKLTTISDPSGGEKREVRSPQGRIHNSEHHANQPQVDETATAILKKKKKPNSLMYASSSLSSLPQSR